MPFSDLEARRAYNRAYQKRNATRLSAIRRERRLRDPLRKEKANAAAKRRRQANPELVRARNRAQYHKNPEAARERTRLWAQHHPDRLRVSRAKTKAKRREADRVQQKAYKAAHYEQCRKHWKARTDKIKANPEIHEARKRQQRDYYRRNAERRKQQVKEYTAANPERARLWARISTARRRATAASRGGICTGAQWLKRLTYYGFACAYCTRALTRVTAQRDHVKPVSAGGSEWPSNLVPACATCNMRKHMKRWLPKPVWARGTP